MRATRRGPPGQRRDGAPRVVVVVLLSWPPGQRRDGAPRVVVLPVPGLSLASPGPSPGPLALSGASPGPLPGFLALVGVSPWPALGSLGSLLGCSGPLFGGLFFRASAGLSRAGWGLLQ